MLKVSKKPTKRRVGLLCLVALGMTVMSCQPDSVTPQIRTSAAHLTPVLDQNHPLTRVNDDDQPPKDVGDGSKGH